MATELKLPEKTRVALAELYKAREQAHKDFQGPLFVALDFLGLDPAGNHSIDFNTGIITPASAPTPLHAPESIEGPAEAAG